MAVIVDPPETPGHGRLWAHVASDSSFEELHAFARRVGIPERGFDRDHYDVPAEWHERLLTAGAEPVSSRELVARLSAAGLRRPKAHTLFPRRPGRLLLRPPRLHSGDLVAVVVPAGPVDLDRLESGAEVLRGWGLEVRMPDPSSAGPGDAAHRWLAGPDAARSRAAHRGLDRSRRAGGVGSPRRVRRPPAARPPRLGAARRGLTTCARGVLRPHRPAPGLRDPAGRRLGARPRGSGTGRRPVGGPRGDPPARGGRAPRGARRQTRARSRASPRECWSVAT